MIYSGHLSCGISSDPGYEYIPLIRYILNKGSDPNVTSYSENPKSLDRFDDVSNTAFDLYASSLHMPYKSFKAADNISSTIIEKLEGEGSEFDKPFNELATNHPIQRCEYFKK